MRNVLCGVYTPAAPRRERQNRKGQHCANEDANQHAGGKRLIQSACDRYCAFLNLAG